MKTTHLIPLLSLIGLLAFSACQKTDGSMVDYLYAETQCADPWGNNQDDAALRQLIEDYLSDEGVDVVSLAFSAYDGLIHCEACSCPSGRNVELRASEDFEKKLKNLGFERK